MAEDARECPRCGVIPHRWKERPAKAGAPPEGAGADRPNVSARHAPLSPLVLAAALLLLSGAVALAVWLLVRPGTGHRRPGSVSASASAAATTTVRCEKTEGDFDRLGRLPGEPAGLVYDRSRILEGVGLFAANRAAPWGFLRIRPSGKDRMVVEKIPVDEPERGQALALLSVAEGRRGWVGVADAAWFGGQGTVFTFHEPETFRLVGRQEAPPQIGALVFDGERYWAATRLPTGGDAGEAWLYRLDAGLKVTGRFPAPGAGCQGLAWDGSRLWFADVFTETLFALDVQGSDPRPCGRWQIPFRCVSGLAWDGEHLWLADYGDRTIRRLSHSCRVAIAGP